MTKENQRRLTRILYLSDSTSEQMDEMIRIAFSMPEEELELALNNIERAIDNHVFACLVKTTFPIPDTLIPPNFYSENGFSTQILNLDETKIKPTTFECPSCHMNV